MVGENSRRAFLKHGLFAGGLTAIGEHAWPRLRQDSPVFSGIIKNPFGEPIAGAEVRLYDAASLLLQTDIPTSTTDSNGRFQFSTINQASEHFLLIKDADTGFFNAFPKTSFSQSEEIQVDHQLLTHGSVGRGPLQVDKNTNQPRGMVAVWQEYQDNKRVVNIEVTAMGEAGPTTRGGTVGLDFVAPSLTVPETMRVNYDDVLMQYFPLSSGGMTRNDRLLSKWHPTRTGLPLFDGSPTGDQFKTVNEETVENASDRNQLAQLLSETLIGQIPLSNLVTGGTELLKVMTADQTETTTQLVGGTELDPPNPNEVDTVGGVSPITSFSTVYQIPIQFGIGGTGDRQIRADIEWATKFSKTSETPDRWRFEQAFPLTPRNPTTPATTPSTTDTITTSFEDADVGAQSPTDPFYLFNSGGTHEVTDTDASDGSQSFYTGEAELRNPSAIAIDLDLTAYETLRCDVFTVRNNPNWGNLKISLDGAGYGASKTGVWTINGELKQRGLSPYTDDDRWYRNCEGDLSEFDGQHTVTFWVDGDNNALWDNIRLTTQAEATTADLL